MAPALKTPETLARIRAQAPTRMASDIARDLGWDLDRLQRTAREFGIELVGRKPPGDAPETKAELPLKAVRPRPRMPAGVDLDRMSLEDIIASLPNKQSLVLAVLRRELDGRFIDGSLLAARIGADHRDGARSAIINLASKLSKGSRYRIQSHKGKGGGYRLVTVKAGAASVTDSSVPNTDTALS